MPAESAHCAGREPVSEHSETIAILTARLEAQAELIGVAFFQIAELRNELGEIQTA